MMNIELPGNLNIKWLLVLCHIVLSNNLVAQIEVVQQKPKQELKNAVIADSIAGFMGGNESLFQFLENNFRLSDSLMNTKKGVSYAVTVAFIVDSTGKLSDIQIADLKETLLPVTPVVKDELVKVIGNMPLWNPGIKEGRKINSLVYLPLNFIISSGKIQLLKESETKTRKLGKEKWLIVIGCVILLGAIALLGIK